MSAPFVLSSKSWVAPNDSICPVTDLPLDDSRPGKFLQAALSSQN